jgi:DNA repair exonuclease SbcCD ATPase subunit
MPNKPAVTRDMVWGAADIIKAAGDKPGCRNIRRHLGDKGSHETIIQHLRSWEASQERASEQIDDSLNPEIIRAISDDIAKRILAATAESTKHIADLEDREATLIDTCTQYSEEIEEKDAVLINRQHENSSLLGRLQEKEAENAALSADLANERRNTVLLQAEFVKADMKLSELPDYKLKVDGLEQTLVKERELSAQHREAAAVAAAKLDEKTAQCNALNDKLADAIKANEEALSRVAAFTVSLKGEREKSAAVQKRLEEAAMNLTIANDSGRKAREEVAELRGQISELRSQLRVQELMKSPVEPVTN